MTDFHICPDKKKLKAIFHQKQTFDVSSNFNGVIRWHTSSGFKDAYKWHLNLFFCVETKPKKNAIEMYSILQNSSEKIEKQL